MSNNKTKKVSVFSILIFVACGLLLIYAIASFYNVSKYIGEMLEYGSISVKDNFYDIMSYYMTNCMNYIVYIVILLSIWWIRPRLKNNNANDDALVYEKTTEEIIDPVSGTYEKIENEVIESEDILEKAKENVEKILSEAKDDEVDDIENDPNYSPEIAKDVAEQMKLKYVPPGEEEEK